VKVSIQPSLVTGTIQAPASKSSMQRACAAALLANRKTVLKNPGHSNDDKAALAIVQKLGAKLEYLDGQVVINNSGAAKVYPFGGDLPAGQADLEGAVINCGESGLSIRMFTPLVALSDKEITITGTGSLLTRPMDFFDEILPQLGVKVKSNNGKLPLTIQGPLVPRTIEIDGSLSSQFLTGLLMAYAASPLAPLQGTEESSSVVSIKVKNLKSKPYIDLTLDVMRKFGLGVPENKNFEEFIFNSEASKIPFPGGGGAYTVEGDWSGGAFLLVAGAIAGNVIVKGLDVSSTQADKKILEALRDCGCQLSISDTQIEVAYPPLGIKAFHFNATDCPDLFPPLVALAAYCKGKSVIEGVSRLAHKESNRGVTLQQEFGKMGVAIHLQDDLMIVEGGSSLTGGNVRSHHDHRIAMACAVAALKANGETIIEDADAINKSYPDFYEHLKLLGASVSLPTQPVNK
jgi:3-phosphoshikimate 1-carboxyvinyltransferase